MWRVNINVTSNLLDTTNKDLYRINYKDNRVRITSNFDKAVAILDSQAERIKNASVISNWVTRTVFDNTKKWLQS